MKGPPAPPLAARDAVPSRTYLQQHQAQGDQLHQVLVQGHSTRCPCWAVASKNRLAEQVRLGGGGLLLAADMWHSRHDQPACWILLRRKWYAHLPEDVTGLLAAPVPGLAALSAVVSAVRGLPLLPVPGRAALVLGLTKPVRGRPADDIGRMAGDAPP